MCTLYRYVYFLLFNCAWTKVGQGNIVESNMLNCDFYSTFCRWENSENSRNSSIIPWKMASIVATDFFHSIPRGVLGQGDMFAYVQGHRALESEVALLTSETIACQLSSGRFSFYLWSTVLSPSGIEVCTKILSQEDNLICLQSRIGYQGAEWKQVYAIVDQISVPFQFVIKAQVQGPQSIIGIDKIEYSADLLCDDSGKEPSKIPVTEPDEVNTEEENSISLTEPNSSKVTQITTFESDFTTNLKTPDLSGTSPAFSVEFESESENADESACTKAECDFEVNICDYGILAPELNTNDAVIVQCDSLKSRPKLKPLEGRCFAALSTKRNVNNRTVSIVLASPAFFTYELTDLYFSYLLSNESLGRLTVCTGSLDNCQWDKTDPPRNWFNWWTEKIELQPGRQQMFFILEQHSQGVHVAIDNIKLVKTSTNEKANCSVYFT